MKRTLAKIHLKKEKKMIKVCLVTTRLVVTFHHVRRKTTDKANLWFVSEAIQN